MKTVSMKLPKDDKSNEKDVCCSSSGEELQFPYGLRIHLADEQLETLGMSALPAVGMPVGIEAVGLVVSASEEALEEGKTRRRVEIQITDLALAASGPSLADRMYGDNKKT